MKHDVFPLTYNAIIPSVTETSIPITRENSGFGVCVIRVFAQIFCVFGEGMEFTGFQRLNDDSVAAGITLFLAAQMRSLKRIK